MRKHERNIIREESGIAMLEFAMVLPIMLLFLLGSVELSRFVLISQKMDKANMTVADVVSQAETIKTSDLTILMGAITDMIKPYPFGSNGRIIISNVSRSGSTTKVRWQYCGGGTLAVTSRVGVTGGAATLPTSLALADGEDTIVTETFYSFSPVLGTQLLSNSIIYKVAYYKPRLGALSAYTSSCS